MHLVYGSPGNCLSAYIVTLEGYIINNKLIAQQTSHQVLNKPVQPRRQPEVVNSFYVKTQIFTWYIIHVFVSCGSFNDYISCSGYAESDVTVTQLERDVKRRTVAWVKVGTMQAFVRELRKTTTKSQTVQPVLGSRFKPRTSRTLTAISYPLHAESGVKMYITYVSMLAYTRTHTYMNTYIHTHTHTRA